ncbi:CbiX/SirB N-terminal domain-containing protein [Pseudorhodobacter sp.]|uniref:CbiX/SirB N-terminal domain-containing protein n=1 Tax=Pseudorhodobacter sp. TaxID=1934400 RepID=UPI0026486D18|nr:CbiX/SirB N-terminal domain-containing protein [Pseudorhodobacter sp.]
MGEAIIIAHGAPADPAPQEAVMQSLAGRVAQLLPGWQVLGTTLAKPGALESALSLLEAPLIYPFFMAEGWFTGTNLPRRLASAGKGSLRQLLPFGTDPALSDVMLRAARGFDRVLIAAHGSKISRTSADTTYKMQRTLLAQGVHDVRVGFVEEAPFLTDVAAEMGDGLCLPFFALRAGHVLDDVPQALRAAGFKGELRPPIGEDDAVPGLIAAALRQG